MGDWKTCDACGKKEDAPRHNWWVCTSCGCYVCSGCVGGYTRAWDCPHCGHHMKQLPKS